MIRKENWRWDAEGSEEEIVSCGGEEGEAAVRDGEPTIEFVIGRVLVPVPAPKYVQTYENGQTAKVGKGMVGHEGDVRWKDEVFVSRRVDLRVLA